MEKKITLCTCAFTREIETAEDYRRHFEMAAAAGFSGFELSYPHRFETANLIRGAVDAGISVVAVHGVLGGGSFSSDRGERLAAVEYAAKYLEPFACFAPCPVVEHYLDRFNDPEKGKYFRESVELLLEREEKMGFVFCMENAPYKPEVNERFPDIAEVSRFVRSFGGRMFMTFDVNHANLHEDPVAVCKTCAGLVKHIHVSDNHGYREEHLVPGTGTIDLKAVLNALYANGYAGPCNLEFGYGHIPEQDEYRQVCDYMKKLPA